MDDRTITQMLRQTVEKHGTRTALSYKSDHKDDSTYIDVTYAELWQRARAFRRGLAALGVKKGERIVLLSENRVEWAIADLATQCMGVVTVAIYSTLPTAQVQFLVADSAARVLVVSNEKQLAKALELRPSVRTLEHVVSMDATDAEGVLQFSEVIERGK